MIQDTFIAHAQEKYSSSKTVGLLFRPWRVSYNSRYALTAKLFNLKFHPLEIVFR